MIVAMRFDPVTDEEIRYLKKLRKERKLRDLCVTCLQDGILPRPLRMYLLECALRPYRRLHVSDGEPDLTVTEFEKTEEEVRKGSFYLAAKGTRAVLAEGNLYLDQITDARCRPARAEHSRGVARTAAMLALHHGLSAQTAYKLGMLHDITKAMSDEEGRKILQIHAPEMLEKRPNIWHSYTAAVWIRENMGITDRTFLNAVRRHTVGGGKTPMDHILYIADKIEPGRGYDAEKEKNLALKDLKQAAALVQEEAIRYILEKECIDVRNT
jgi:predicted HD superfamily hydrolase involved in NAD metabolism